MLISERTEDVNEKQSQEKMFNANNQQEKEMQTTMIGFPTPS